KGTDLILNVKDRKVDYDDGDYTMPGSFGNLPAGEASISPAENICSGLLVVDYSIAGIGKLKEPVKIHIDHGFISEIKGGEQAKALAKMLADVKSELAYNIAELGIGTNDQAKITGSVLEDEKVIGTVHIGIGNNASYGGKIDVPIHIDCVISKPTVVVDGKRLMEDGEFLLDKKSLWWKTK
ncbi:MAG: aminopeptidase, partial [Nanoarchaeota archaeon]|nr:aminopeptidase [Nanoarchaeota archaeon]